MPISVTDLKPGDRVILNCPKARGEAKREAQFEGIFKSFYEAMASIGSGVDVMLVGPLTVEFLASGGKAWAVFLMQTVSGGPRKVLEYPGGGAVKGLPEFSGTTQLRAAFLVEPDGGLREQEGRRVFIEQRQRMGHG